jgi:hypothetical protein
VTGCPERASRATKELNGEEAVRLLLHLYTELALLPAAQDGGRSAVLARFGAYEVRLAEFPPVQHAVPAAVGRALSRPRGASWWTAAASLRSRMPSRSCASSLRRHDGCTMGADMIYVGDAGRGCANAMSIVLH